MQQLFSKNELEMLATRHYLVCYDEESHTANTRYYNAYLLANFGIVVDKPELLTKDMVQLISEVFHLNVPKSFYKNPQDLTFFSKEELIVEQLISYFYYGSDLGRIEVFKKLLPEYTVGDEIKLREFSIVTVVDAVKVLKSIVSAYCAYTRPLSVCEEAELITLYNAGYYCGDDICCKETVFSLLPYNKDFARFLDKKDIVKLSIKFFGDGAKFTGRVATADIAEKLTKLASYIPYVKHCPMSKKQAKYFNKIVSLCGVKTVKASNVQSPDRRAMKLLSEGNVVAAADIYASNGSMLERRIKMLLSRANPIEAVEILNMLPSKNPIALYQMVTNLTEDTDGARTFTFFRNNKVRKHTETEYEARWRKSRLNNATVKLLLDTCVSKIREHYGSIEKLGKLYIADNFYKLGVPTNTSASGRGIDVLPTGSRLSITADNVRTFVHWKEAFDIDSSLILVNKDNEISTFGWFNYCRSCEAKDFSTDILFSGDITGVEGAEYFDIKLNELAAKGYKYAVQTFHGYADKLNRGQIYAGYQNKDNLKTTAWDPKNIEMQFRVQGDSRACIAFVIDIQKHEMIIINQIVDRDERVVNPEGFKTIEKFLLPDYLTVNVGFIVEAMGELVASPDDADVILDDSYVIPQSSEDTQTATKTVIRSWELEKLVELVNR